FPNAPEISFGDWFIFAFPVTIVLFILFFSYLYFVFIRNKTNWKPIEKSQIERDYIALGKPQFEEKVIMFLFVLMALLWFLRADLVVGSFRIPGWSSIFKLREYLNDG